MAANDDTPEQPGPLSAMIVPEGVRILHDWTYTVVPMTSEQLVDLAMDALKEVSRRGLPKVNDSDRRGGGGKPKL